MIVYALICDWSNGHEGHEVVAISARKETFDAEVGKDRGLFGPYYYVEPFKLVDRWPEVEDDSQGEGCGQ